MKKISSPHQNGFVPKDEPPTYKEITIEDIEKCITQIRAANISKKEVVVTEYNETHYHLSGCAYGLVNKKYWDDLMRKAAGIESPL